VCLDLHSLPLSRKLLSFDVMICVPVIFVHCSLSWFSCPFYLQLCVNVSRQRAGQNGFGYIPAEMPSAGEAHGAHHHDKIKRTLSREKN